jgi:hypothetical protein
MDKLDQWHNRRWAKFTASEDYKLLEPGKEGMFGVGATTYIEQKAFETTSRMQERPELSEVKSLLHGKAHEYPAYIEYKLRTGLELDYFGDENPIFYPYEPLADEAGGSPDSGCISEAGKIYHGAEFKCPKNGINHFRRLKWKDQWDVKQHYIQTYTQCQKLLMCTGAKQWDFVSFDDRQIVREFRIKIIPIYPDKNFQNNLDVRLRCAIKEKYRIISEKYGIEVTDRADFMQKFKLVGQSF